MYDPSRYADLHPGFSALLEEDLDTDSTVGIWTKRWCTQYSLSSSSIGIRTHSCDVRSEGVATLGGSFVCSKR